MRKSFSSVPSRIVILAHGAPPAKGQPDDREKVEIRVEALPAGYDAYLRQVRPPPERMLNGVKPLPASKQETALYRNRHCYLMIERGIRSDGCLETCVPTGASEGEWNKFADDIERELVEAHFSEGDMLALLNAVTELSGAVEVSTIEAAAGN